MWIKKNGKYKGEQRLASPQSKEIIKYLFNHIYDYALEARLVERNYAREFTLDKKVFQEKEKNYKSKVQFSKEEIDKLWKSIEFVPFADMIVYACYSGWRPTELIKLKIKDVDLKNGFIKGGMKTSAGKNRLVPIHPLVEKIIMKYYDEAISIHSEYLFNDYSKKKGIGLSYDQYLVRFKKVIELMEFDTSMTPHCTRHTFITMAQRSGVDKYIIKIFVGHDIKDITEYIYTHRTLEEMQEAMDTIK